MAGNKIGDLKVGIGVESTVDQDLQKTEKSLKDFAQTAKQSGDQVQKEMAETSKAVGNVTTSYENLNKAQRRAVEGVRRQIERRLAPNESSFFTQRLVREGVDPATIESVVGPLRAQEKALEDTGKAYAAVGMTAKQTRQAMRLLPAQITDIVTSLASGMPMYLVAIQQGGQLRDSFGGFGNVLKGVAALINPFALALGSMAAAAAGAYYVFERSAKITREFERTLISTGNAAGITSTQLIQMSREVSDAFGSQAQAAQALNMIAANNDLIGQSYEDIAEAAVKWSAATGESVEDVIDKFVTLATDPMEGLKKLDQQYNFLTASVYKQVTALLRQGDASSASKILVEQFANTIDERTPLMIEQTNGLVRAWRDVKGAITDSLDALFGVETLEEMLSRTVSEIVRLESELSSLQSSFNANDPEAMFFLGAQESELNRLRNLEQRLADQIKARDELAKASKAEAEQKRMLAKADEILLEGMTDLEKAQVKINEVTKNYHAIILALNLTTKERTELDAAYSNIIVSLLEGITKGSSSAAGATRDLNAEIRKQIADYEFETSLLVLSNTERQKAVFARELEEKGIKSNTAAYREYTKAYAENVEWRQIVEDQIALEETRQKEIDDLLKQTSDTADEMSQFAVQAARNIESVLGNTLFNTLKGNFDNIGAAFSDMIMRMSAELMASQIARALFGNFGSSNQIGGILGQIGGAIAGSFFGSSLTNVSSAGTAVPASYGPTTSPYGMSGTLDFAMGGYTGDGGKYQPAGVVHKGEYVLNQETTKRLGVGFLDRLNRGYAEGGYVSDAPRTSSGVVINIKNEAGADGYQATAQARQNSDGGLNIDVLVRRIVSSDISNNGALAQQMANTFGLRRAI